MKKTILALLVLWTLSACTNQIQPSSEEGRMCLSDCSSHQEICIARAKQHAQNENQDCVANRVTKLKACQKAAATETAKQECEQKVFSCEVPKADRDQCNADYQQCFVQCGGDLNDKSFTEKLREDYLDEH